MCINKRDRLSPHERISHVGGIVNSQRWKITEDEAIRHIESRNYSFYVMVGSVRANVIIAIHNYRKYLKADADGILSNNLLSLPEYP